MLLLVPMAILDLFALSYYIKLFRHINKKVWGNDQLADSEIP